MRLNFVKLNPNGNITLLVTSPVPRAEQASLAARLMRSDVSHVETQSAQEQPSCGSAEILGGVEQVGFVEAATLTGARARLQMMGGEFCGNASMSLAALLARKDGLATGARAEITLEVSGANGLVRCQVERTGECDFLGAASMPLPQEIGEVSLPGGARSPLVRFPGIAHLIVPEGTLSPVDAEALAPRLCAELCADALGLLFVNPAMDSMRPLVYVRSTGSAVWERGCGSGTAALGAYLAIQSGRDVALRITQPGGDIIVRAVRTTLQPNKIQSIQILGRVRIVASGSITI